MVAFDIMDKEGKPDGAAAKRVTAAALARGLVLLTCGSQGQTIRILVPLTETEEHLDGGCNPFGGAGRSCGCWMMKSMVQTLESVHWDPLIKTVAPIAKASPI